MGEAQRRRGGDDMNTLPKSFIDEGLKLSEGATVFGVKFAEMSREELIAVAAHGWTEEAKMRKELEERTKKL